MKPQTYLRLSLLLPYLLWVTVFLLTQLEDRLGQPFLPGGATDFLDVGWLAAVYLIGIFFWFVPYTILALGLWIWSLHRQANTIVRGTALSPFILAALILLEINILSIVTGGLDSYLSGSGAADFLALNGLAVVFTLAAGYLCVGIGFGGYKILQALKIIPEPRAEPRPIAPEPL